ncbi:methylaspartate mutase (plasmid) [Streptomyces sp. NBC_01591]|uniref:methylaspartate mutase n=1 Tax=Streptomyces sp. NBC_01591 TaxID=2975888 RepID=UPI002DD97611|nr:methylaspartate mutase [Streptomyces sp. NBC_01591]WSD73897.1 methylaspartate mutase [Streptomyces sp. NBC_01591]
MSGLETATGPATLPLSFGGAVSAASRAGELVVQPRMGFGAPSAMRSGLEAVRHARARTVGTLTVDSYTRVGDLAAARRAVRRGQELNGYPIVAHGPRTTRELRQGLGSFAVQVRHGSARPLGIVSALLDAGLDATEGGPVSYCLPYGRTPLRESVEAWARSCELLAERSATAHLETFGGCMLGQLCPPSLLVALSVLEGLFFRQHGLRDISLSYAQQTDFAQDAAAVAALRRLSDEYLGDIRRHIVLYTYMGVFPRTEPGALALLRDSARLAVRTGAERLLVKTTAEAYRIPTVRDNVRALEEAARAARQARAEGLHLLGPAPDDGVLDEARTLVEAVLELDPDVGRALTEAFARGYLDVPYCLHADNAQRARGCLDADGRLRWLSAGAMPVRPSAGAGHGRLHADDLLGMLSHVQTVYDSEALDWTHVGTTAPELISCDSRSAL